MFPVIHPATAGAQSCSAELFPPRCISPVSPGYFRPAVSVSFRQINSALSYPLLPELCLKAAEKRIPQSARGYIAISFIPILGIFNLYTISPLYNILFSLFPAISCRNTLRILNRNTAGISFLLIKTQRTGQHRTFLNLCCLTAVKPHSKKYGPKAVFLPCFRAIMCKSSFLKLFLP